MAEDIQGLLSPAVGSQELSPMPKGLLSQPEWRENKDIIAILKKNPIYEKIIMAESSGDANTPNSRRGAIGLMQIMPSTALGRVDKGGRQLFAHGMNRTLTLEELKDPLKNIQFGVEYFEALKKDFGTDANALIAYNWGPDNFKRWRDSGKSFFMLPKETRDYLSRIIPKKDLEKMVNHNPIIPPNPENRPVRRRGDK